MSKQPGKWIPYGLLSKNNVGSLEYAFSSHQDTSICSHTIFSILIVSDGGGGSNNILIICLSTFSAFLCISLMVVSIMY